ncbi:phosphoribosylformylglycinamidine cyclo-ligase [Spiroplasma corruscae]|uniref:Phosphoribosylformylglycinamidine cyclo-ligase n=1 Tax=Spiroplasma corruscae TaxID=216934 RepID=A0A222EQ48_9MOLU|nr:phosphoribosylformylglycinamidine cyclo-ligase [Spiroplasma corruscae]ASP28675.1 phosphoribosylformylglycinamidine cyclo-ligase [Spiroplasma corruscae]
MSQNYKKSGVDIHKGYEVVNRIKKIVSDKLDTKFISSIGSFGCSYDLSELNYKKPILVSGTDGVGTKLLLAIEANNHKSIGIDLVAMCVNDILTLGAKPLYFLDYIAIDKIDVDKIEDIIIGIVQGCLESDCSLLGGETAEMKDMYIKNHYDLAGFITGCVEKEKIIDFNNVKVKDKIIAIQSSGVHSNGYSLVRKIFFKDNNYKFDHKFEELDCDLITELLKPTKIYADIINEIINSGIKVSAMANITGGGIIENIPRVIPKNLCARINKNKIEVPPIFNIMQSISSINDYEMFNVFNMGVGFVVIVKDQDEARLLKLINNYKSYKAFTIGEIINYQEERIVINND